MRVIALFAALFLLSSQSFAQQTSAPTQRDTQAISVMSQMTAATGWGTAYLPTDATASGTVTQATGDNQQSVAVTIKIKGSRIYRVDVQNPSGPVSTIINGDAGAVTRSGSTSFMSVHSAISQRAWAFPFFSDLCALSDAAVGLQYAGTETLNGNLAHRVEITRSLSANDPLSSLRSRVAHLTVWISASTWLPMQVQFNRVSDDNPTAIRIATRTLSDYRVVDGLAIPFHQEQWNGGRLAYSLQLNSMSFNVGLSATEFTLPSSTE